MGKIGEGKEVTLSRDKNEIRVETDIPFSKRLGEKGWNLCLHSSSFASWPLLSMLQSPTMQISQVPHQEVSQEEQPA